MENSKISRLIYTLFVGVLISVFVGVGVDTFYSGPSSPSYTAIYEKDSVDERVEKQQDYDKQYDEYTDKSNTYNRNVSIITLTTAVILLLLSLYFEKRIKVLGDSIMLGGLFTLIYSVIRGFVSTDNTSVFLVVAVGLFVVMFVGYHRFVIVDKKTKRKKS